MNQTSRIILSLLCGVLILAAPFLISSPSLLEEAAQKITEQLDQEEDLDLGDDGDIELNLGRLLFTGACAEEAGDGLIVEEVQDDNATLGPAVYELPLDFTVPPAPKAENFSGNTYADETIIAREEDREEDGVLWHLIYVQIASPTQLRTATAIPDKLTNTRKTSSVPGMAKANNAVCAINGNNYQAETDKKTFEYRMTQKVRSKTNWTKDILIIDDQGDFHLVKGNPDGKRNTVTKEQAAALEAVAAECRIVNAMTFGPALVVDGEEQDISEHYGFNPNRKEPRAAIGQMGRLSYVMAIAEGRGSSSGVNFQELAHFMASLGCQQAFNLDGGNSAVMTFGDQEYRGMPSGGERSLYDIIYFATALPEG